MRLTIVIYIFGIIACNNTNLNKKFEAFWNETHFILKLDNSDFMLKYQGHFGNETATGKYTQNGDTIILQTKKEPNKFLILNEECLIELLTGFEFCIRSNETWETNRHFLNVDKLKTYSIDQLRKFPEISLEKIIEHYETSGLIEKAPSKKYFNKTNEGIFVFYTLFTIRNEKNLVDEIGSLVTQTNYKKEYGWGADDKDQTFVELNLIREEIKIGNEISVGINVSKFEPELGLPILKTNDKAVFVGKYNTVCIAYLENDIVKKIKYGKYNFDARMTKEILIKIEQ